MWTIGKWMLSEATVTRPSDSNMFLTVMLNSACSQKWGQGDWLEYTDIIGGRVTYGMFQNTFNWNRSNLYGSCLLCGVLLLFVNWGGGLKPCFFWCIWNHVLFISFKHRSGGGGTKFTILFIHLMSVLVTLWMCYWLVPSYRYAQVSK